MKVINPIGEISVYDFKNLTSLFSEDTAKMHNSRIIIDKSSKQIDIFDDENKKYPSKWTIINADKKSVKYMQKLKKVL